MKQENTWLLIALIVISLFISLLDRTGLLLGARGFLEQIIARPGGRAHQILSTEKPEGFDAQLWEKQTEIDILKKENEDLRAQFGIAKSDKQQLVEASVLSTSRGFIIDKGVDDGIRAGQTVVFKNIFVGKIVVVGKKTSKVLLPFETDAVLRVKTTQTKDLGLVKGQGQQALLSEVILSENLKEEDMLSTVGDVDEEGLGVRPDFLVGKIANIHKSDDQLFQEAKVDPLIDYKNLQNVFIIL